jgi:hypothetical protein
VVQLHDLSGDRRFQRSIIICFSPLAKGKVQIIANVQGKSGSVAFPRTKLVLVAEAALFAAPALSAERAAVLVRNSVADIFASIN